MEYLQYLLTKKSTVLSKQQVLNLIINGIPSIPWVELWDYFNKKGFKPYYKWNTFNTKRK